METLLLGDEAVGQGAIDAAAAAAFSYPGTPATEILEYVLASPACAAGRLAAAWVANEKVAYEAALGASYAGGRALVSMKHVGLNVAADAFMSSALSGANAGLVLAVADDPGMHSSQNEQDSRVYGQFAQIPVLEPSCQQEAYDMTRAAFELSERVALPVMVRLVTRLAHSRSGVRTRPPDDERRRLRAGDWRDWTLLPVNARRRYRRLLSVQPVLAEESGRSGYNRLELRGRRGVIACGLGYAYAREAMEDDDGLSLLKIGHYPVPAAMVRELVDHCDDVLVVEDGYPIVERQLVGLLGVPGKLIRGRLSGDLPADGEMTADLVRAALRREAPRSDAAEAALPGRPPQLCTGCPHCDTFRAIQTAVGRETRAYLFSDIGCYTLAALPPYDAVDTCVDMGASISMGHGAARAGAHPVICTIGDSTFVHSGMTGLISAARDQADMTVVILDNASVAMTGGQETLAHGADLVRIVCALGVDARHVRHVTPSPKNQGQIADVLREEIAYRGLSVLVASRPCIYVKRRTADAAAMAG